MAKNVFEGTHLLNEPTLDHIVVERMRGHVKQQKVLLLGGQYSLFGQILGQSLANILQLVAQLQWVPRFTAQVLNPALHRLWRLGFLNVSQRLIQQHVASRGVRFKYNFAVNIKNINMLIGRRN